MRKLTAKQVILLLLFIGNFGESFAQTNQQKIKFPYEKRLITESLTKQPSSASGTVSNTVLMSGSDSSEQFNPPLNQVNKISYSNEVADRKTRNKNGTGIHVYIGAVSLTPTGDGKNLAGMDNTFGVNTNIFLPLLVVNKTILGFNIGGAYTKALSNHHPVLPPAYPLAFQVKEPSLEVLTTGPKSNTFRIEASPQIRFSLLRENFLSLLPTVVYGSTKAQEFKIIQTSYAQANTLTNTILQQSATSTGLFFAPKLRYEHFWNNWGTWCELYYQIQSKLSTKIITWKPFGEPNFPNGAWDEGRFLEGQFTNTERNFSNNAIGINAGIAFRIPKKRLKDQSTSTTTQQVTTPDIHIIPPVPAQPVNGESIKITEIKKPIIFRWKPAEVNPVRPITYKLVIYEITKEQTITVATSQEPILMKEAEAQTQLAIEDAVLKINGKSFAWRVDAYSQNVFLTSSSVNTFSITITDPSLGCFMLDTTQYKIACNGVDLNGNPVYRITNLVLQNIGTGNGRTGLNNTQPSNYIIPSGFSISNLTPVSSTSIPPNGSVPISFDITGATGSSVNFIIQATISNQSNPGLYCDKTIGVTLDLPKCVCDFCKDVNIQTGTATTSQQPNSDYVTISQPVNTLLGTSPLPVKSLSAEIVYYEIIKNDTLCYRCEKDNSKHGKFVQSAFNAPGFSSTSVLPSGEVVFVKSVAASLTNNSINLTISAPSKTKCCVDSIKLCVLYTITTADCKVCTKTECYEIKRN